MLGDLNGRLLKGTGQRPGALSPRALGQLSWNYPRSYVARQEAQKNAPFSMLRQHLRALGTRWRSGRRGRVAWLI